MINVKRVLIWSTLALIIPILGQLFVDGWNWGPGDFAFAWVFFNLLGFSYSFLKNKITNQTQNIVARIVVIVIFVFVWVMLATG